MAAPVVRKNFVGGPAATQAVQRTLLVVLVLNLGVTAVKLVVGAASGSLAVLADAFHSLVDSSSNVIGLIGVWVSARPADHNHPYGHRKYETIATLAIGAMLMLAGYEIGQGVIERLSGQSAPPDISFGTVLLMLATFAINLGVVIYETRQGRRWHSPILLADAQHTRVDLFVTVSVIASLLGAGLGWWWLDPLVALGVVGLLFRAAWGILRDSSNVLTDVAVLDPQVVQQAAAQVAGVRQVVAVRSRGTPDAAFVDLHVQVNPAMNTHQAHRVASDVESHIAQAFPSVVETLVHIEPQHPPASTWESIMLTLRGLADELDLNIHDVHIHTEPDGGYALEMHVEVDRDQTLAQAHDRVDAFEQRIGRSLPHVRAVVTHIEPLPLHVADEAGRIARAAELRARIQVVADTLAGVGACHNVHLHNVGGHITATLHLTQPATISLVQAHALAETIEGALHSAALGLHRVVVHVEPPESPTN